MIKICGDVHGKHYEYYSLVKNVDYSIQLGDFGFDYDILGNLDSDRHKIIGGNHDNYDVLYDWPHMLGDFGCRELGGLEFFFIRGAYSVDKMWRVPKVSWWGKEELNWTQSTECICTYIEAKPDIVLSHDCPKEILSDVLTNNAKEISSNTNSLLSECFKKHQPKYWLLGHHHQDKIIKYCNTTFMVLNELSTADISTKNGTIKLNNLGQTFHI